LHGSQRDRSDAAQFGPRSQIHMITPGKSTNVPSKLVTDYSHCGFVSDFNFTQTVTLTIRFTYVAAVGCIAITYPARDTSNATMGVIMRLSLVNVDSSSNKWCLKV
jgi:hypothetical protein